MGLFDRFKKKDEQDHCASGYPLWEPSADWTPEFEDDLVPEAYDAN